MFASSPQGLEDVFFVLITVVEFLLEMNPPNSYGAFLQTKGFGVGRFTRQNHPGLSEQDRHGFQQFAMFFREFLEGFRAQVKNHLNVNG